MKPSCPARGIAPVAAVSLFAALLLVGGADARAASSKLRKPTLLWQSYPLIQRPVPELVQSQDAAVERTPTLQLPAAGYGTSSETLILFLLGSLAAGVAGVLLVRSSVFNRPEIFVPSMLEPEPRRQDPQAPDEPEVLAALSPTARLGLGGDGPGEVSSDEASASPETCRIFLRGEGHEYQLRAASLDLGGEWRALAASTFFPLRNEEFPIEQASSALDDLIADLERAGWRVSRLGESWYDLTFERAREEAT